MFTPPPGPRSDVHNRQATPHPAAAQKSHIPLPADPLSRRGLGNEPLSLKGHGAPSGPPQNRMPAAPGIGAPLSAFGHGVPSGPPQGYMPGGPSVGVPLSSFGHGVPSGPPQSHIPQIPSTFVTAQVPRPDVRFSASSAPSAPSQVKVRSVFDKQVPLLPTFDESSASRFNDRGYEVPVAHQPQVSVQVPLIPSAVFGASRHPAPSFTVHPGFGEEPVFSSHREEPQVLFSHARINENGPRDTVIIPGSANHYNSTKTRNERHVHFVGSSLFKIFAITFTICILATFVFNFSAIAVALC